MAIIGCIFKKRFFYLNLKMNVMRHLVLKITLIFTALLEISIGMVMIAKPEFFNEVCGEAVKSLSTSFAVGAISIGLMALLSFVLIKTLDITLPLGVLGIYNLGIAIVQGFYPVNGVPAFVPVVFHIIMAMLFFYFALQAFKK